MARVEEQTLAGNWEFMDNAKERRLSDIAYKLTVEEFQQALVPIEEKWNALFAMAQELFGWPEREVTQWMHPAAFG